MKAAGVLVFSGGLVEDLDQTFSADDTSGTLTYINGPFAESKEWLGGSRSSPWIPKSKFATGVAVSQKDAAGRRKFA